MSIPTFRRATRDDLTAIVALLADDPLGKSREDSRLPLDSGYLSAGIKSIKTQLCFCYNKILKKLSTCC